MDGNMTQENRGDGIELLISGEVQEKMTDRMIRPEDLRAVIAQAEETGNRLRGSSGHFLSYCKLAGVTFWVEYSPEDGGYRIHTTYSHRMEIGEEDS